ncbi:hypothetical protein KG086_04665 [Lacticaseibacillus chiayiensis]|uniref:hypothetical protein n=1 Tax=Lacticaseibacillus chiayiensis TaxID=2100821 RepID=UPI001BCC747B|nr:hypothetical protein [Lacticaseibacillus chiayiensis]QVI35596.1 hypothetical protein KG086_04665 [Lacticaseibacillus chiayiensis]
METQLFDFNQLNQLHVSEKEKVKWVDDALRMQSHIELPAKISLKPSSEVFYNFMPVVIPDLNVAGVKVINRIPGRHPTLTSHIMIYDLNDGHLKAIMDGDYITTARTGSVAAHSIQLLARSHYKSVGFIGLGNQARATVKSLLSIHDDPLKIVLLKYKDQASDFKRYLQSLMGISLAAVQIVTTPEEVFRQSDVVVSSVTYAAKDILTDTSVMEPGTLLLPIHTRGFMNLDAVVDRIYCDSVAQIRNFKYFDKFRGLAQINDVLTGHAPGRQNDQERLTVYNIGTALHDLFFAARFYELANKQGKASFDWQEPQEKVWYR